MRKKRFAEVPPLIDAGRPLSIDGMNASRANLRGVFYAADMRRMMRVLRSMGVDFTVSGSPMKGVRALTGEDFEIIDPYKAWLFDPISITPDEVYEKLNEWHEILGENMNYTAASTFARLCGKIKWCDEEIKPWARAAYIGGMQWSRPGVYVNTYTSDMHEAYFWAMHMNPLPKKWRVMYGKEAKPSMMSITCAKITTNGRNLLPILPINYGGVRAHLSIGRPETIEGYWYGPDIAAAKEYITKMDVHWTAYGEPSWILPTRMSDMMKYPKNLRKRLTLVGYGIHAQAEKKYEGVYAGTYYEAARALGSSRVHSTMYDEKDEMAMWWLGYHDERPYVRIDWGGLVTARVRHRVMTEGFNIMKAGGEVARIYVDSVTATRPAISGYGTTPGTFKLESEGPAVIGPPGIGMIAGSLKRSGVDSHRAMWIIDRVRNGTYHEKDLKGESNWTGLTEEIPT